MRLFGDVYSGRRVLVTGHTGFKGSWLTLWLRELSAQVSGLALDPDTNPSHWSLLGFDDIADHRVDIRDADALTQVLDDHRPEIVFHLAAQPLVRRAYADPIQTFTTNVGGVVNLLEAIRHCPSVRVVVNATTDKVYAEHVETDGYRETDPLGGHDPYSTSKACAELISDCYRKSFFSTRDPPVGIATARAGNVLGGGDWAPDRLVPDLVRAATSNQPLVLRNPAAVRPWQHVLEPLSGYLRLGQRLWGDPGLSGAWNFGPGPAGEISVLSLAEQIGEQWPAVRIECDGRRQPHEAAVLRLNSDKAHRELPWRPVWTIEGALARTVAWYRRFQEQGLVSSAADLTAYIDDARHSGLEWAA